MEQSVFYLIQPFPNFIFRHLLKGKTIEEIKVICAEIPEVPADYKERIDSVFKQLLEFQLIVESDEPSSIPEPELNSTLIQSMQEDGFKYIIEPSNEVQKLLLDDPIHDVSLDGWTPFA